MTRFLLRRLGFSVLVLALVASATFVATLKLGDPVSVLAGAHPSAEDRAHIRRFYGLDRPIYVQLATYGAHLAQGDLGRSYRFRQPVAALIVERLPRTVLLGLLALLTYTTFGIALGTVAAARRGRRTDAAIMAGTFLAASTPELLSGKLLLIVVAYYLGWFPIGGYGVGLVDHLRHAVLPAMTLAFGWTAYYARLTRHEVTEVMRADYMRTARAKGLSPWAALVRHALRNALLPLVTALGVAGGALFGGAVVTEAIFAWPGVGKLAYDATLGLDVPVIVGCVIVSTVGVLSGNLISDVVCARLDPRLRSA